MDATKLMGLMKDKKAAMAKRDKTVKPRPGKNRIVLLPGWRKGEEHIWFHDFGQHFIKNAAKEIQAVYPCADATFGHTCPVCQALSHATSMAKDDETVNLLAEAKASRTVLINVLDLDGDNPNTPVIYEIKRTVFGQLVELIEEWGVKAFQQEIVISRDGKGLNTKYSTQISPKEATVPAAALEKLSNLDEYVKQESEEQQRRALTSINAVAGILPAPTAAAPARAIPATPSVADELDAADDALRALETASAGSTPSVGDDLDDLLGELK